MKVFKNNHIKIIRGKYPQNDNDESILCFLNGINYKGAMQHTMARYKKILSIDIGLSTTKICEMDYKKKNPKVYKCVIFDTPENTIEDGYIRDKKTFSEFLKEQISEAKIRCRDVVFTMVSNKIINREVIIPAVKDKLIESVVNAEINDYFPMDITEHVITYTVIERIEAEKQLRLIVYAAPETMIKNYYNVAEELKFNIVSLDYVGNSTYNWLKRCYIDPVSFVLQVNEHTSMITVIKNNIMVFQRVIGYGINIIAEAVVESNYYEVANIKDALKLMHIASLFKEQIDENLMRGADEAVATDEQLNQAEAKDHVTSAAKILIGSINRVMEYYSSKNKARAPIKLYLTGYGAGILGLDELLTSELGVKIEIFNPADKVSFKRKIKSMKERGNELLSCFGASIAPINFVSKSMILEEQRKISKGAAVLLILLAVVSAASLTIVPYYSYQEELLIHDELKEALSRYPSMDHVYTEYSNTLSVEQEVIAFHNSTISYSEIFSELIGELETKLPSGAVLHSLNMNEIDFTMSVSVKDKEMAAKFLLQLQLIPYIGSVYILGLSEVEYKDVNGKEVLFSVTCTYTLDVISDNSIESK